MSQDPTAICPGCCQRVAACMCHPTEKPAGAFAGEGRNVVRRVGPARFDRVTRGPDGKFCHWFRGEPVNDPEQRPHDWPYCHTPAPDAVAATEVLVALADLEAVAKAGPANPERVRQLAAKIRAALIEQGGTDGTPQ